MIHTHTGIGHSFFLLAVFFRVVFFAGSASGAASVSGSAAGSAGTVTGSFSGSSGSSRPPRAGHHSD